MSQPAHLGARREHGRAILFLLLAALLWSTGGFFIKWVDWHPMAIAGGRSAISALVFAVAFRKTLKITWSPVQLTAAVAYALTVSLFVVANKLTTAANTILLQYTAPVHVALLSAWLLKEQPSRRDWLTIAAVLAGMILFFFDQMSPGNLLGNLCALFTGLTFGLFIVLLRKQRDASPAASVFLGNILEAVLITLIEPVLNPLWVVLLMGETPSVTALIGGSVIIGAVTARQIIEARRC